jgi:hypothetical protein
VAAATRLTGLGVLDAAAQTATVGEVRARVEA